MDEYDNVIAPGHPTSSTSSISFSSRHIIHVEIPHSRNFLRFHFVTSFVTIIID